MNFLFRFFFGLFPRSPELPTVEVPKLSSLEIPDTIAEMPIEKPNYFAGYPWPNRKAEQHLKAFRDRLT